MYHFNHFCLYNSVALSTFTLLCSHHCSISRTFLIFLNRDSGPLQINACHPLPALPMTLNQLSISEFDDQAPHISGMIQDLFFGGWPLTCCPQGSSMLEQVSEYPSSPRQRTVPFVHMRATFCFSIHPPVDTQGAPTFSSCKSCCRAQGCTDTCLEPASQVFSLCATRWIAGSCGYSVFRFLRTYHPAFPNVPIPTNNREFHFSMSLPTLNFCFLFNHSGHSKAYEVVDWHGLFVFFFLFSVTFCCC